MRLAAEFYRLPFRFDVARLQQELTSVPEAAWIPHPDNHQGNMALPLISLHGQDNDLFHGPMRVTPHLRGLEYVQQVLASLGEVYGRSRLMRLAPGCEVPLHTDTNYHWHSRVRIHVPITTSPEVIFHCGDKQTHMGAGECWIFDTWRKHRVVNGGKQERVHLVFDTAGSSRFWDRIEGSHRPCDADGEARINDEFVPYQPGRPAQILTENYNATPVKSPGEVDGLITDLLLDIKEETSNSAEALAEYQRQLQRFARDWRMLFSLYGYESAGSGNYSGLINAAAAALSAYPGKVKTASNGQDAVPIFMHRVLDAALEPERLADYLPAPSAPAAPDANGKISRNAPCPCGSGKKYKHCHG